MVMSHSISRFTTPGYLTEFSPMARWDSVSLTWTAGGMRSGSMSSSPGFFAQGWMCTASFGESGWGHGSELGF
jgi:hypothetical protein